MFLNNYLDQLESTKQKFFLQSEKYDKQVLNIPEKEKTLRAIERNQQITESLYFFYCRKEKKLKSVSL